MKTSIQTPCAIFAYVHHDRRIAALVTLRAQTDFALRTDLVLELGRKLAMHAVAAGGVDVSAPWTFDASQTVGEVIAGAATALGEELVLSEAHVQS